MGLYPVLFAMGGYALEKMTIAKNTKNRITSYGDAHIDDFAGDTHFTRIAAFRYSGKT